MTTPNQEGIDRNHFIQYKEVCTETIVHFQHFAELYCKDILREEHELLAVDAYSKPIIYHKLLRQEEVEPAELEKLKTIEFSETLKRLLDLIGSERIDKGKYGFIVQHKETLMKLNWLRNRMWHRGTYILRYPALDKFVGGFVLPFVKAAISMDNVSVRESVWKYKQLQCGIDPIEEIVHSLQTGNYNLKKVAILKELGRAAYLNPLKGGFKFLDDKTIEAAERDAKGQLDSHNSVDVRKCPVCGVEALSIYEDTDYDGNPECPSSVWRFSYAVLCSCCKFSMERSLDNPRVHGLNIEDYWYAVDL